MAKRWVVTLRKKPLQEDQVLVPVVRVLIKEKKNSLIVKPFSKTITGTLRLMKKDHLYKIFGSQAEAYGFFVSGVDQAIRAYNEAEHAYRVAAMHLDTEVARMAEYVEWDNE